MKGNKILLKLLKNIGVNYVTGIVGREGETILFDDEREMEFILVRHEQTSGIASEVCARKGNGVQACFSTIGPGITNMATGVASAYKDGAPLIAIGMQVERDCRKEIVHQYLDNVSIMKPITKYSVEPNTIYELISEFKQFPKYLFSGKQGPVFISICIDLLKEEYKDITEEDLYIDDYAEKEKSIDMKKTEELYKMIKESKQPIILAGKEALKSAEAIEKFAYDYNIPIGTSLAGKGVISEEKDLSIGAVTKYWDKFVEKGLLKEIFEKIDLIILVGFDYSEDLTPSVWNFNKNQKICRIGSISSNEEELFNIDINITADISKTLEYLENKKIEKKEVRIDINKIREAKNKNINKKDKTINTIKILSEIRKK